MTKEQADFLVADYGTVIALSPISAIAREACSDGTIAFESWQMMGGAIMVDHRIGADLIESLRDDGYLIADD